MSPSRPDHSSTPSFAPASEARPAAARRTASPTREGIRPERNEAGFSALEMDFFARGIALTKRKPEPPESFADLD